MAIDLSTAGVKLYWASGTTATTPTTGFKAVIGIRSIPDLNVEPESIDATTLENEKYRTSVEGLRDLGGALEFGANLTEEFMTAWDGIMTAYSTAIAKNDGCIWWEIVVPGLTKGLFFAGKPADLGMPSMEVGALLETVAYITPTSEPEWAAKVTT